MSEFSQFIFYSGILYLTFILAGSGFYAASWWLTGRRSEDRWWLAAIAIGSGPLILSWMLTQMLRLVPGLDPRVYIIAILVVFAIPTFLERKQIRSGIKEIWHLFWKKFSDYPVNQMIYIYALIGLWSIITLPFIVGGLTPLMGSDSVGYANVARLVADARDVSGYPYLAADGNGGFFGAWTHPMGYINLLTWGYFIQGGTENAGVIKLITPYFFLSTAVALTVFGEKQNKLVGIVAAIFLLSTPIFFNNTLIRHIDIVRTFSFMVGVFAVYKAWDSPTIGRLIFAGLASGMAMYSHSIGMIILPIIIPLYIIVSGQKIWKSIIHVSVIFITAFLVVGDSIYINLTTFGNILQDDVPLWHLEYIRIEEHRAYFRGILTEWDRWATGFARGLTDSKAYGDTYWAFGVGFLFLIVINWRSLLPKTIWEQRSWIRPNLFITGCWVILGFYGIILLTVLAGMDLAIKNARYIMTVQPFVALGMATAFVAIKNRLLKFLTDPEDPVFLSIQKLSKRAGVLAQTTINNINKSNNKNTDEKDKKPSILGPSLAQVIEQQQSKISQNVDYILSEAQIEPEDIKKVGASIKKKGVSAAAKTIKTSETGMLGTWATIRLLLKSKQWWLLVRLVGAFLFIGYVLGKPVVSTAYKARVNMAPFAMVPSTVFDPDRYKLAATGYPLYRSIDFANKIFQPEDRYLSFRKTEFAYYGKAPFYLQNDPAMLPAFPEKGEGEAVWSFLHSKGINYVLEPGYAIPSIYNTAMGRMLANPKYAQILFQAGGYRIYRLTEQKVIVKRNVKFAQDFDINPQDMQKWSVENMTDPMRIDNLERRTNPAELQITNERGWRSNPNNLVRLYLGRGRSDGNPYIYMENLIEFENGAHVFNANVQGQGRVRIWLFRFSEGQILREKPYERVLIWDGVLGGGDRLITKQFLLRRLPIRENPFKRSSEQHRLVFELVDGGDISLKRVSIARLEDQGEFIDKQLENDNKLLEARRVGWKVEANKVRPHSIPFTVTTDPSGKNVLSVSQFDSRSVNLTTPQFNVSHHAYALDTLDAILEPFSVERGPRFYIDLQLSGRGRLKVEAVANCRTGKKEVIHIGSLVLNSEPRDAELSFVSPCRMKSFQLRFSSRVEMLFGEQVPGLPFLELSDLSLSAYYMLRGKKCAYQLFNLTNNEKIIRKYNEDGCEILSQAPQILLDARQNQASEMVE